MVNKSRFNLRLLGRIVLYVSLVTSFQLAAEVVVKTGISAPQAGEKPGNIEQLRRRAITSAMELAVMQVTGAEISSERGGLYASRDKVTNANGQTEESSAQTSTAHSGAKTKLTGNVKVLEILEEWQEGDRYFVKLKLDVANEEDLLANTSVGTLWERIGKPAVGINTSLVRDQKQYAKSESLQNYLEDNLSKNKLDVNVAKDGSERFSIQIKHDFRNAVVASMGTYKSNCELSFSITDNETKRSVADFRMTHGPDGGFDEKQAEERCTEAIARPFSEKLLTELAIIFNNEWNNGKDFKVSLVSVPGEYATKASEIVSNAYQVTSGEIEGFNNGLLTISVAYKGKGVELIDSIKTAFFEAGIQINLSNMVGNQVEFIWLGVNEL